MATPRRPFCKLPLGFVDDALAKGASPAATLLLAQMALHRAKRAVPGLLCLGPAGLAETLTGATAKAVAKKLKELERLGLVVVDIKARPPLILVRGCPEADPPYTLNAVRAMAAQCRELPLSQVKTEAMAGIAAALTDSEWLSTWIELSASPESNPSRCALEGPDSGPSIHSIDGPLPIPIPIPSSVDPSTTSAAAALFPRAWARLPQPPFAAAAADDFTKAERALGAERFEQLVIELACSKWVGGQLHTPPTLRRLLGDAQYLGRILAGEFRAIAGQFRCPDCDETHQPFEDCPAVCPGCQRRHAGDRFCSALRTLQCQEGERAAEERRRTWRGRDGETFDQLKARVGFVNAMMHLNAEPASV